MTASEMFVFNMHGYTAPVVNLQPQFKFQAGDWLIELGIPCHHLRIIETAYDYFTGKRQYRIHDTRLNEKSGYKLRDADDVEAKASLYLRPQPGEVQGILERAARACDIDYSIPNRTDCESLQRWIQTDDEGQRQSWQFWLAIGFGVVGIIGLARQN